MGGSLFRNPQVSCVPMDFEEEVVEPHAGAPASDEEDAEDEEDDKAVAGGGEEDDDDEEEEDDDAAEEAAHADEGEDASDGLTEGDLDQMSGPELDITFTNVYDSLFQSMPSNPVRMTAYAFRTFTPNEPYESINFVSVRRGYQFIASGLNDLVHRMRSKGLFSKEDPQGAERARKLHHYRIMLGQLFSAAEAALACSVRMTPPGNAVFDLGEGEGSMKYPYLNTGEISRTQMNPVTQLIYFFLHKAQLNNLRRSGNMVYEQRYLGHRPTHAWVPLYPITEFIYTHAPKEIHADVWEALHGRRMVQTIADYLEKCTDLEFPVVSRHRRYMSFVNGVYDIYEDLFMPYGDHRLTDDVVACNMHNREIPPEWFTNPTFVEDPSRIPTPNLDMILREQGFEPGGDEYRWILAWALGRPQYDMGTIENNHRNGVLILGHAGTGKTTLAKVLQSFYDDNDTDVINSNCEPKYALANLVDKFVWFCTEVKKNFQLDTGMLLLMLEGNTRIAIQKKHATAWSIRWKIPGLMCGNELPDLWVDAANSLKRRMLIIEFNNKPERSDTNLEEKLSREMAAIMVKANRMYRQIVRSIGRDGDIDDHLPEYFHRTLSKFERKTQPLVYMITSGSDLRKDRNGIMSFAQLTNTFNQWCRQMGRKAIGLDEDEATRQLKSLGMQVVRASVEHPVDVRGTRETNGLFVKGLVHKNDMIDTGSAAGPMAVALAPMAPAATAGPPAAAPMPPPPARMMDDVSSEAYQDSWQE